MGSTIIFMLAETVLLTGLFVLGILVRLLLNKEKKPYVVRNPYDPNRVGVNIYRIRKYGSRYIEYQFRNEGGSWKPVIDKKNIIGVAIAMLIMSVIMCCLVGIIDFLLMMLPVALFAFALSVSRYYEAYRVLMKS